MPGRMPLELPRGKKPEPSQSDEGFYPDLQDEDQDRSFSQWVHEFTARHAHEFQDEEEQPPDQQPTLQKSKVYVSSRSSAPPGVQLHGTPKKGLYYEVLMKGPSIERQAVQNWEAEMKDFQKEIDERNQ